MREVFSDFMRLHREDDGRVRIPLGTTREADDLKGLQEGEPILIRYPSELEAEGIAMSEPWQDTRYWYSVIPNIKAIRRIDPESERQRSATSAKSV